MVDKQKKLSPHHWQGGGGRQWPAHLIEKATEIVRQDVVDGLLFFIEYSSTKCT